MFGTIARMQLKPGSYEKMMELGQAQEARQTSQSDPNEVWLTVAFEDEASYRANADDPETDKMSQEYQKLLAAPPEWHDGEIVNMTLAENRASV